MRPSFRLIQALPLVLAFALSLASWPYPGAAERRATPVSQGDPDPWAAIQPRFREEIAEQTDGSLPRYKITATIASEGPRRPPTITGEMSVSVPAPEAGWSDGVFFRLYPNDPAYGDGGIEILDVRVNGVPATPELSESDTVLRVPVAPEASDGELTVTMRFVTTIPERSEAAFGIFSGKPRTASAAASHWYPMLAGRTPTGWDLSAPSRNGDLVYANAALLEIGLDVPGWMDVVLPGDVESAPSGPGRRTVRAVIGPSREAPLFLDDGWATAEAAGDGVTVRVHGDPLLDDELRLVAGWTLAALETFSARFGPYPYATLDVVLVDLAGALGMEFPALIVLDPDVFAPSHADNPRFPEIIVAHEVAHQWWYGLVENNQHVDAFIDEGLAQYSGAGIYPGDRYGPEEASLQIDREIRSWYDAALARSGDHVADQPSEAFPDMSAYGMAVYAKSALGFDAIRGAIGDPAFFGALRQVAERHRFDVIDPGILRGAFERACDCDIGPLWVEWFESAAEPAPTPAG